MQLFFVQLRIAELSLAGPEHRAVGNARLPPPMRASHPQSFRRWRSSLA